jgi:hypothetical protein
MSHSASVYKYFLNRIFSYSGSTHILTRSSRSGSSTTRGALHCGLPICIKKYLKAKEKLWKLKYFTMQKYNLQKILYKKPQSFKILEL